MKNFEKSGHTPVLLEESIAYLDIAPGKLVIDATLGGGGHTIEILKRWPQARVLGIEYDVQMFNKTRQRIQNAGLASQPILINDSYINLPAIAKANDFYPDAVLFDLGLSSWHYESSGRGFSFQKDELLDMRFNPIVQTLRAADIINKEDVRQLEHILATLGEEKFAKNIAEQIIKTRTVQAIVTTGQLVDVIRMAVPGWYTRQRIHFATKTFQALRVAVNDELGNIRAGIRAAVEILKPHGRLVVISFQGAEDKIVRELFKEYAARGMIKWVTRSTIRPSWNEIKRNPRARSAKMKIASKLVSA